MGEEAIGRKILTAAMKVHSALGSGLLESAYEACLAHELRKEGMPLERQIALPIVYDGERLDAGYRLDLWIERKVIVEVKSVDKLLPIHGSQLLSYLRLSNSKLGYLLNFNVVHMKDGIKRIVNKL
ncbi:MAG TPA: GxxExxY protein [Burkholderiales bacterium]|jgi:GxxExxY protein|nr:GxxExxY protein [Burkholderiales bacterium]